jgi:Pentapeptide repeats (8 copies)
VANYTREQLDEIVKNGKKFRGMKLHGCIFDDMNLEKADFRGAAVAFASFQRCKLKEAIFEGANCTCANFDGANVHRANFKDANMCDAKFDVVDAFGITITMDCRCFSHLKVNAGFWWGLIYYAFLMDPLPGPDFVPETTKEKLSVLFGPARFTTLKNLYANRQM